MKIRRLCLFSHARYSYLRVPQLKSVIIFIHLSYFTYFLTTQPLSFLLSCILLPSSPLPSFCLPPLSLVFLIGRTFLTPLPFSHTSLFFSSFCLPLLSVLSPSTPFLDPLSAFPPTCPLRLHFRPRPTSLFLPLFSDA